MRFITFIIVIGSQLLSHVTQAQEVIPEMESVGIRIVQRLDFSVTGKVKAPIGGSLVYLRSVTVLETTSSPKSYLISGLLVDGNAGAPVENYPLSIGRIDSKSPPVFAGMTNALGRFTIRVWVRDKVNDYSTRVAVEKNFEGYLYLGRYPSPCGEKPFPVYGVGGGVIRYDFKKLLEASRVKTNSKLGGARQTITAPQSKPQGNKNAK